MKKKLLALTLVLVLVGGLVAGCGSDQDTSEEAGLNIGLVTDTGGLGDESFNDSANAGLDRAVEDFGVKKTVLEPSKEDDYYGYLKSLSEDESDLTFAVGYKLQKAVEKAAETFPDSKFAIIDSVVEADNVMSINFAEHEGSFLVGAIAGLKTETDTIGFIGGVEGDLIKKFEYGFRAGVKATNPDAEVIVNYAGTFGDVGLGKEIALAEHAKGADVIYHAAGGVGIGLINAAKENDFWAIGVDQDQSALAPDNVLCSMTKRVDNAVYAAIKKLKNDNFESGIVRFNLENDGVGYSDDAGNLTDELKQTADKYKAAIKNGEFEVPQDKEEFEAFEAPEL